MPDNDDLKESEIPRIRVEVLRGVAYIYSSPGVKCCLIDWDIFEDSDGNLYPSAEVERRQTLPVEFQNLPEADYGSY